MQQSNRPIDVIVLHCSIAINRMHVRCALRLITTIANTVCIDFKWKKSGASEEHTHTLSHNRTASKCLDTGASAREMRNENSLNKKWKKENANARKKKCFCCLSRTIYVIYSALRLVRLKALAYFTFDFINFVIPFHMIVYSRLRNRYANQETLYVYDKEENMIHQLFRCAIVMRFGDERRQKRTALFFFFGKIRRFCQIAVTVAGVHTNASNAQRPVQWHVWRDISSHNSIQLRGMRRLTERPYKVWYNMNGIWDGMHERSAYRTIHTD